MIIDHFILRTLDNNDLEPSLPAESNIIARRLAMDITGYSHQTIPLFSLI